MIKRINHAALVLSLLVIFNQNHAADFAVLNPLCARETALVLAAASIAAIAPKLPQLYRNIRGFLHTPIFYPQLENAPAHEQVNPIDFNGTVVGNLLPKPLQDLIAEYEIELTMQKAQALTGKKLLEPGVKNQLDVEGAAPWLHSVPVNGFSTLPMITEMVSLRSGIPAEELRLMRMDEEGKEQEIHSLKDLPGHVRKDIGNGMIPISVIVASQKIHVRRRYDSKKKFYE